MDGEVAGTRLHVPFGFDVAESRADQCWLGTESRCMGPGERFVTGSWRRALHGSLLIGEPSGIPNNHRPLPPTAPNSYVGLSRTCKRHARFIKK